jgi:Lrp/AsnC family leucine-responsive transcriptional regulator
MHLDDKQRAILRLLQSNGRLSSKDIAEETGGPVTTAYARVRKMEELGIIKGYKAILDPKRLDRSATAFVFASFAYPASKEGLTSHRRIAKEVAKHPEVQEVHIITGDWDMLIKLKGKDVDELSNFVMNDLRTMDGVEKTLTCIVFETSKESTDIMV